jgi:hypothetical protein
MRRREFILGLAMLANVGRASAQERVRCIGALITEPTDVLETLRGPEYRSRQLRGTSWRCRLRV